MADTVTSQLIHDGPRNAVYKFTNTSDGTGESAVTKVDVSGLSGAPAAVRIDKIEATTHGMGVDILWDADTDELAWNIAADIADSFDFSDIGGIANDAGTGVTGDIKFTTVAATSADRYSIVLHLVKKYA
jgi:hypothetical protein